MTPQVLVRDARPEDIPGLLAIRYVEHPAIHRDRLRDAAAHDLRFLVAECKRAIVGFCSRSVT